MADVTGSTATFVLTGAGVGDVLAQGVSLDLSQLAQSPHRCFATDGWGIALMLEQRGEQTRVTVDATFADYLEHALRTAAGLATAARPGTMRSPPPPIRVG